MGDHHHQGGPKWGSSGQYQGDPVLLSVLGQQLKTGHVDPGARQEGSGPVAAGFVSEHLGGGLCSHQRRVPLDYPFSSWASVFHQENEGWNSPSPESCPLRQPEAGLLG